jgi:TonB family protein
MPFIVPGFLTAGVDVRRTGRGAAWMVASALASALASAACTGPAANDEVRGPSRREPVGETREVPRMLNREPPFHYPAALYSRRVQGNVTLRLVVDSGGRVTAESTSVAESSGYPALDSAALRGAAALSFAPALRDGRPVAARIRFPVHFRHPAAEPMPGDSVGARR